MPDHIIVCELPEFRGHFDGMFLFTPYVVQETAFARTKVQHHVVGADVFLEEIPAEHSPHAIADLLRARSRIADTYAAF
jgi:hypothetical protein